MRILHTSDWHLGRYFHTVPLEEDHDFIFDQLINIIEEREPDLLIIAGDIFDRAVPPQSALTRFARFIQRATQDGKLAIVAIAGNHDSAAQIGMMAVWPNGGRALVRGPLERDERPLMIADKDGEVAVSALPFSYEFAARECFGNEDINCPEHVLRAQVESARSFVPQGARWIIVAHAFVTGASPSASERPLSRIMGGIETVPTEIFDGAHYVALGHLHRPQKVVADHIRYSGAPLALGFDEEGEQKSVTIVDLGADGSTNIELIPLAPKRRIRTIKGKLAELVAAPEVSEDFTSVILTDETPQIDPMKRVRAKFPNAVQLVYERQREEAECRLQARSSALDDPKAVIGNFMSLVRQSGLTEAEQSIVDDLLVTARQEAGAQ